MMSHHSGASISVLYLSSVIIASSLSQTYQTKDDINAKKILPTFPEAPRPQYHDIISYPHAITQRNKEFFDENGKQWDALRKLKTVFSSSADFAPLFWEAFSGGYGGLDGVFGGIDEEDSNLQSTVASLQALASEKGSSSRCVNDTGHLLISMVQGKPWALKFLDSIGRPGPGLSELRFNFVGDYDLCRSQTAPPSEGTPGFKGNYCTLKASVPNAGAGNPLQASMGLIQWGVCMPSTCNDTENTLFLSEALQLAGLNGTLEAVQAESHNDVRTATGATYAAIVVTLIIGLLMLTGTIYDIVYIQLPVWRVEWREQADVSTNNKGEQQQEEAEGEISKMTEDDEPLLGKSETEVGQLSATSSSAPPPCHPQGKLAQTLLAFSVYTNASKVLNTTQAPGAITCIHGIRFLSMTWVILGHSIAFGLAQTGNAASALTEFTQRWSFDGIANALSSVDTFFTLSGLLTAYVTLKQMKKTGWNINWPLFYFHRFWRLTPPYMLSIVLTMGFIQYCGQGPLWSSVQPQDKEFCEKNWWTNLLYINNLVKPLDMCFGHSWYLANDMQFFWVSPLMLIPIAINPVFGMAICGLFLLASFLASGIMSTIDGWPATLLSRSAYVPTYFTDYYIVPWCRIPPFVVGIMAGYILVSRPRFVYRMSAWTAMLGWMAATATGLAVIYGLRGEINGTHVLPVSVSAFYNAVSRAAWGAAVCWVIVACEAGWGGFVNTFLSWSPFVFLGRLTYMAYLLHLSVQSIYFQNQITLHQITTVNIATTFMAFLVASLVVSFIAMLALESPMVALEKVIFGKHQKKK